MLNWNYVTSPEQVEAIIERSREVPCAIFKHSTRCSISSIAKFRLKNEWYFPEEEVEVYFLDLIAYRPVSQLIADTFQVQHESPQLLLIKDGTCIYHASHLDITVPALANIFQGLSV